MAASFLAGIFEKIWEARFPQWRSYALALTRNLADAEDIVVEAAAKTLRARPELNSEVRLHHYMKSAIRTAALDALQRRGRQVGLDEHDAAKVGYFASSALQIALSVENRRDQRKIAKLVYAKLTELKPERRQAIELIVLREPRCKLREVAAIQGVTTSTVHYRLTRGLEELAQVIKRARNANGSGSAHLRERDEGSGNGSGSAPTTARPSRNESD